MNNLQAIAGSVARQSPQPTTDPAVGRAGTGILSQEQFDRYAANWLEVIYNTDGHTLHESFLGLNQEKVNAITFPLQSIVELVSVVGVHHIKARFLIQPDEVTGTPHFTMALFAADELGKRLSSYYVADAHWLGAPAAPAPLLAPTATAPSTVGHQIANVLAHKWAQGWVNAQRVETAMFDNAYGPLNGYTFEMGDFMAPMFKLTSLDDASKLQVNFCLHEFSRPTLGGDQRAMTFGLTVQVVTKSFFGIEWGDIFDISKPCPPYGD